MRAPVQRARLRDRQARESLWRRSGRSPLEAYDRAYRTDPTSAFGGIIAFNRELDGTTAAAIIERQFVEVLAAPAVSRRGRAGARREAERARVGSRRSEPRAAPASSNTAASRAGCSSRHAIPAVVDARDLKVVTRRKPTPAELADLLFAWRVCKFVKSNAIVFARDRSTIGVGAGQMSRVYSTRIAAMKAADEQLEVEGSVMASDAFFPFRDGLDVAAEYGIRAVIQPGGSKKDAEVIAAADEHGIAMVFTGMRHFRH